MSQMQKIPFISKSPLSIFTLYAMIYPQEKTVYQYPNLKMLFNWKKGLTIKRTLFGHADIRNSSLSVEKFARKAHIFFNTIFLISKWPCTVLVIIQTPMKYQTIFLLYIFCYKGCNLLWNHSNGDFFTCEDIMILQKISTDISLVFT